MADYVMAKVIIQGDSRELGMLREMHFSKGEVDFNTIIPVPEELMIEQSSAPETGYDALYGDWTKPAKAWTWKEAAKKLGHPFPLESREQVIACINAYENPGLYFDHAKLYKNNNDKHGYFTWYGWCVEHWGTKSNAEEASINNLAEAIEIRFATAWSFPDPIFKVLSQAFPALEFDILTIDEIVEQPERYVLKNGERIRDVRISKRQARKEI